MYSKGELVLTKETASYSRRPQDQCIPRLFKDKPAATNSQQLLLNISKHWLFSRVLVGVLALACFINSSWGDFVFDDSEALVGNKDVNPETPLSEVFADDFWGMNISKKTSHKSYRPFTVITFRWNYWFAGGLDPFGFHLTNVVLHVIVSLLFLEVCCCLLEVWPWNEKTGKGLTSLCPVLAAVLFAVHPVHTESVAGVVGRAELTSAVCFFTALLTYAKSCRADAARFTCNSLLWLTLTVSLGGCAMLFKEQGVTVMGICIVYDIIFYKKVELLQFKENTPHLRWKTFALRMGIMLATTGLLIWGRFRLMATGAPEFKPTDNPAAFADSLLTRILSYNYIYSLNAWLLLHPWWLCFDWSMGCIPLVESPRDARAWVLLPLWGSLGVLGSYILLGRTGKFKRLVTMSLAFLVLPFIPASNVFLRVGFVVAERVLYLPSAGFCLLVALGVTALKRHFRKQWTNAALTLAMVALVLLLVSRSIKRSSEWLTEETLFTSGAAVCPLNAKVHYNIGKVKADSGYTVEGETAYREAIRLYPEYDQALNNLGNLLKETERPLEAEEMFHRALKSNPEFAAAWMNLGIVQAALKKNKEAEESYILATKYRKKYPDAYYNLGNLYIDVGQHSEAIVAFKTAIALQRDHSNAWHNLGLLYENLQMNEEAESTMREAISILPDHPQFYFSLGVLLGKLNRLEAAEQLLMQAISLQPEAASYHANLGVIYHLKKQYSIAEEKYQYALMLDPGLTLAKENLHKLLKTQKRL